MDPINNSMEKKIVKLFIFYMLNINFQECFSNKKIPNKLKQKHEI